MANKTEPTTTTLSTSTTARAGLVPSVANLALDIADRGQSTAFAIINDARGELRAAVDQGLDFAEKLVTATFRFARKSVSRIDDATGETVTGVERVLGGAVKNARETTRAAAELASTTAASVTGAVHAQA